MSGIGQIVRWNAPERTPIRYVDGDGQVVTVRIAPQDGAACLFPDAAGVPPRVLYTPDREPVGVGPWARQPTIFGRLFAELMNTDLYGLEDEDIERIFAPQGEMHFFDYIKNKIADQFFDDRPRTFVTSSFANKRPFYQIDLGCSFSCPWPGLIELCGGAPTGVGVTTSQQDVEIVVQKPEIGGSIRFVADAAQQLFLKHALSLRGERPRAAPTMTYFNVGTTPIQVPLGAVAVQTSEDGQLVFTIPGVGAGPLGREGNIAIGGGASPLPVSYVAGAGGTFAASSTSNINVVSFQLSIS
jgi:hypothetical protein